MDQFQVTQTLSMTIHLNPVPPLKDVVHYFRSGCESIGMVGKSKKFSLSHQIDLMAWAETCKGYVDCYQGESGQMQKI